MTKRSPAFAWARIFRRQWLTLSRESSRAGQRAAAKAVRPAVAVRPPPAGDGAWTAGVALGVGGARRYRLYQPAGAAPGDQLALIVMLHGCAQDATSFALATRMNRLAAEKRFLVLYPEQDHVANPQGCWNWFDTKSGRAYREAALIMKAIDQVCLLHPVDRARVAIAGLSAGASMAALVASLHPERFKAVVMHSGIPPGTAHSALSALAAVHRQRATRPLPARTQEMASAWPPLLVVHGRADRVVSVEYGRAAAQQWADAAGAKAGTSRTVQRGRRHAATVTQFKAKGRMVATLMEVDRLGHAWSGGAPKQPFSDALGPDASRLIWTIVSKRSGAERTVA